MNNTIRAKIHQIETEAEAIGAVVVLDEDTFIDDEHLNCFWYGGEIGSIKFNNGWTVNISVSGEVRLNGQTAEGEEIDYVNKNNDGAWGEDVASIIHGDSHLAALEDESLVEFGNNNWVEFNFTDPDGNFCDCGISMDNLLDDNVLDAFLPVSSFLDAIEEYKGDKSNCEAGTYDCETCPINGQCERQEHMDDGDEETN